MALIDPNTPRYQLPFEELPRGFVAFPEHIVKGVAGQQAERGFSEAYARDSLERHTLIHYYEGLPVAYRPVEGGIEVLALGWEETARFLISPKEGIKVVQP